MDEKKKKILENILNKIMVKKYSWWRKLIIDDFSEIWGGIVIQGEIYVDQAWAKIKYYEHHYKSYNPNLYDEEHPLLLGDIISFYLGTEIDKMVKEVANPILNKSANYYKVGKLVLKF